MIREITHSKSLYEFWVKDLNMSGAESCEGDLSEYVLVASVCPHCGQQQFIKWSLSGLNYHIGVDENDIDVGDAGNRIGSVMILYKKIFEELDDYLKNAFHCIACGECLSFDPGYFYSSTRLCVGDLSDGGEELSKCRLPYGYKWIESSHGVKNICFDGYHNDSLYKEKSDYINHKDAFGLVNDEGVYDGNPISKAFLTSDPITLTMDDQYIRIHYLDEEGKCTYEKISNNQLFELMSFYRDNEHTLSLKPNQIEILSTEDPIEAKQVSQSNKGKIAKIREVDLYKSIEDCCVKDLHLDCGNDPEGWCYAYKVLWFGSVCPCCGQEQVIQWKWSEDWPCLEDKATYKIKDPEQKKKAEEDNKKARKLRQKIYRKVLEEVDDYLRNHFICVSCGSVMLYRPGYFYSSTYRFDVYDNIDEPIKPFGFNIARKETFLYHTKFDYLRFENYEFGNEFRKTSVANDYIDDELNDDHIYDLNLISSEYICKTKPYTLDGAFSGLYTRIEYYEESIIKKIDIPVEQIFEIMKIYRDYDEIYADEVSDFIREEIERLEDSLNVEQVRNELSSAQITDILKEMIGYETSVISLNKRLKRLKLVKDRENRKYLNLSTNKEEKDILDCEKRIETLNNERVSIAKTPVNIEKYVYGISKTKPKIEYPSEPSKPREPIFEKPGLFNKKKVESENAVKKQMFDAELARWQVAVAEYERLLAEAKQKEVQQKEEINQEATKLAQDERQNRLNQIDAEIANCKSEIERKKEEIIRKEKEIQAAKESLSELPWNKEYDQAVELLKKTLEAKIIYEKSEIIFPKYQNLVCYSQFYEYFQAGRCETLTGPNGAYNLYESELRQNIIINKLDDISESLEEIKQNQFMIYTELQSINANISKLDNSMNKILNKVSEIGTNVDAIRSNTEIIEENTRIAAYYSKKNAEITNAMGYLVALK